MSEIKNILFLCTGNSCRSQMAEGWTRHLKGQLNAYSAGVAPHGMDPRAVAVMAEAGVDISGQQSQHINEFKDIALDVVITVCGNAQETCPVFPGTTRVVHHGFDDPPKLAREIGDDQETIMAAYRRVRDEIKAFVETLPHSLNP